MQAAAVASIALQAIQVLASSYQMYQEGTITLDELKLRWSQVGVNFDHAVALWKGDVKQP